MEDCYHDSYSGAPADGSARTRGCSPVARVLRGGSWFNDPTVARSADRGRVDAADRGYDDGFRPARIVSP
jgi:formylglycine-generating enzyme required for sulfatase activity